MAVRGRNRKKNIEKIEREFDEPLHETIRGLREARYTWVTIAGALDINVFTLFKWRRMLGMEINQANRIRNRDERINDL